MPQGKLMKAAVKRLKKLWPPKKKRKRLSSDWYDEHHRHCLDLTPPPPPLLHYRRFSCSSSSPSTQPSAPPLPSWLEPDDTGYAVPELTFQDESGSGVAESNVVVSYHQYMAPEPAYGVPLLPAADRRERLGSGSGSGGGFFGCLAKFGINVIRCFCPCFHIREVR
ncbi:uncharacterized protein LOC116193954 [Punica granatum]|uniref:Uncharacterized protein n=2 Tax=Punica granatum TaxID=22663 RepID=A0A218X2X2_PUNGR|nr:uncharacterized protein LOC116193954 [Punica granatum]OWM79303.1 hypothetical protein CDL15_Pgr003476 [Punica granatum]PKI50278.1 hypothetical protein CRG98_029351 [Punica granatum]